jgi:hypothetical protein
MEINPAAGWDVQQQVRGLVQTTRHLQASTPGDRAIMDKFGSLFRPGRGGGVPNVATAKFLSGMYGPGSRQGGSQGQEAHPEVAEAAPARPLLTLRGAYEQSGPDRLILGQNPQTGALAVFNPAESVHAGIIGVTGTRKTTSLGYTLAAQALRNGYHLICLDPKGGADWKPFAGHGEWVDVDAANFRDAVEILWGEHDERHRTVLRAGVANLPELGPQAPAPVLVILEEYGDLIRQLRIRSKQDAQRVDDLLDRMLRLSRMTAMHLVFIDQYPEEWSNQVMGGTKAKYVFQMGPNQGAKVKEYHADGLPDHSVFLHRRAEYRVFDARPKLRAMLAETPRSPLAERPLLAGTLAAPAARRAISGRDGAFGQAFGVQGEGGIGGRSLDTEPANERTDVPRTASAKQERVWAYLAEHPTAGPTEVSQACQVTKSYAHDLIGRFAQGEPDRTPDPPAGAGERETIDVWSAEGRRLRRAWLEAQEG